jgi:hypothetical protein
MWRTEHDTYHLEHLTSTSAVRWLCLSVVFFSCRVSMSNA